MSTQIDIDSLLTVGDLDLMPDDGNRYEIIEGELFVSCSPSLKHQRVSRNMVVIFSGYLDHNPIGEVLHTPGVIFSNFTTDLKFRIIDFHSNERPFPSDLRRLPLACA